MPDDASCISFLRQSLKPSPKLTQCTYVFPECAIANIDSWLSILHRIKSNVLAKHK